MNIDEAITETDLADASVEESPAIIPKAADLTRNEVTKVDYSGAQLWKVSTNKTGVRVLLARLRRRNRKKYTDT